MNRSLFVVPEQDYVRDLEKERLPRETTRRCPASHVILTNVSMHMISTNPLRQPPSMRPLAIEKANASGEREREQHQTEEPYCDDCLRRPVHSLPLAVEPVSRYRVRPSGRADRHQPAAPRKKSVRHIGKIGTSQSNIPEISVGQRFKRRRSPVALPAVDCPQQASRDLRPCPAPHKITPNTARSMFVYGHFVSFTLARPVSHSRSGGRRRRAFR